MWSGASAPRRAASSQTCAQSTGACASLTSWPSTGMAVGSNMCSMTRNCLAICHIEYRQPAMISSATSINLISPEFIFPACQIPSPSKARIDATAAPIKMICPTSTYGRIRLTRVNVCSNRSRE
ncbi:hypothetical protein D3C80_807170 [compost metagenome]